MSQHPTAKEQAIIDHYSALVKEGEDKYEEYVNITKDTESELYEAIDELEKAKADLEKKLEKAESMVGSKKDSDISKDTNKLHADFDKMSARCEELERAKILFEQSNEELLEKNRILEVTYPSLSLSILTVPSTLIIDDFFLGH